MAAKKDNLPLTLTEDEATSTITYANEVVAIIAGVAANEVNGVAGMCSSGINEVFARNKNITKGVKVELGSEEAAVDIYLNIEYGTPIQTAASNVQENVRKAIESMTGLHVVRVDVHVQGVSFEKENQETAPVAETGKEYTKEKTPEPVQEIRTDAPAKEDPKAEILEDEKAEESIADVPAEESAVEITESEPAEETAVEQNEEIPQVE